jgi:hypothetical protein
MRRAVAALAVLGLTLGAPAGAAARSSQPGFLQHATRADLDYLVVNVGIPARDFRVECRLERASRALCHDAALHTWFEGQTEPSWATWQDTVVKRGHRLEISHGEVDFGVEVEAP